MHYNNNVIIILWVIIIIIRYNDNNKIHYNMCYKNSVLKNDSSVFCFVFNVRVGVIWKCAKFLKRTKFRLLEFLDYSAQQQNSRAL